MEMKSSLDELVKKGSITLQKSEAFMKEYEYLFKASIVEPEKRGTLVEEAMIGFVTAIGSSLKDSIDFAIYAYQDPANAGKAVLKQTGDSVQSIWNIISNPSATAKEIEQEIEKFSRLSKEDQARAFGVLMTNFSPTRRTEFFMPDGHDGGNGSGEIDGSNGNNGVEGIGNGHPNGTHSPTHNAKGERIDNVDVPKVKEPTTVTEFMKQEEVAISKYADFRIMKNDTNDIARNTGWKEADIQQIKNHLFIEKHKFDNGQIKSFAPDYQQALAWERLMQGNYNKNDILFLNHELFESNYMKKHGVTYEQGHLEAQKHYNWSDSIIQK
jgi:hypothetical protein